MKVLCFIDSLGQGGGQRHLINIARLLQNRGCEVVFLVYWDIPFFADELHSLGIRELIISADNKALRMIKIRKAIREINPDVLISFLEAPNFISCVASIGKHKWKLITNELSAKPESFSSRKGKLYKAFERFSDAIVCNSENARQMWIHSFPMYESKMHVIYNPVCIEIQPEATASADKINLLVTASYQSLKNPIALIKAVAMMRPADRERLRVDWYGRTESVAGDTRVYDDACSLVKELELADTIFLHEEEQNIYPIILNSDVIGLFSDVEGLPNAVCEGMYFAKPIVMTKVSDYSVLVDESNGILCKTTSPEDISNALSQLISLSSDDFERMGKSSKEKAQRLFAPRIIEAEWISLIQSLCGDEEM